MRIRSSSLAQEAAFRGQEYAAEVAAAASWAGEVGEIEAEEYRRIADRFPRRPAIITPAPPLPAVAATAFPGVRLRTPAEIGAVAEICRTCPSGAYEDGRCRACRRCGGLRRAEDLARLSTNHCLYGYW
jgi:hypothetical protein